MTMLIKSVCAQLLFTLTATSAIAADDRPTLGFVYNAKETSSLQYDCRLELDGKLRCHFIQLAVRQKLSDEDVPKELERAKKQLDDEVKAKGLKGIIPAESCKDFRTALDVLNGKIPPPKDMGHLPNLTVVQKQDLLDISSTMLEICASPTIENVSKLADIDIEKRNHTCIIDSNPYDQTFKRIAGDSKTPIWVVESSPSDACGIVHLDKWEVDPKNAGYWNYVAKKTVTNRNASMAGGLSCSAFDENEYLYKWQKITYPAKCRYIDFSF